MNRFSGTAAVWAWAFRPRPIASSQGRAMAMLPAPLMTARRSSLNRVMVVCSLFRRAIEEAVALREGQQQLLHVVVRAGERRQHPLLVAGIPALQRSPVGEAHPVRGEAAL